MLKISWHACRQAEKHVLQGMTLSVTGRLRTLPPPPSAQTGAYMAAPYGTPAKSYAAGGLVVSAVMMQAVNEDPACQDSLPRPGYRSESCSVLVCCTHCLQYMLRLLGLWCHPPAWLSTALGLTTHTVLLSGNQHVPHTHGRPCLSPLLQLASFSYATCMFMQASLAAQTSVRC